MDEIVQIMRRQAGVISRRQVEACGLHRHDIERALRRREWVRLLPGVYLDHTGEPSWLQRAWAGVLVSEPAALAGSSALRAVAGPGWRLYDEGAAIEVAVDLARHPPQHPGYRFSRTTDLGTRVHWQASPPRVRFDHAVIDVAARASDDYKLIGLLADSCQSRCTTPDRLIDVVRHRARLPRRALLVGVLDDLASGTCSVLEHGYLTKIERPHALPLGSRQPSERHGGRALYRDVDYAAYRRIVELDGMLFHNSARKRDLDLDRDLDAACTDRPTVRLGWGQVFDRPCRTTSRIARFLQGGGWSGSPRPCGPSCLI